MMTMKNISFKLILFLLCLPSIFLIAQEIDKENYPFPLPDVITATYNFNSQQTEVFNNNLIGYNIMHFNTDKELDFIRKFDPISIRFPDGAWSNFYNWETDELTRYNDTTFNNGQFSKIDNGLEEKGSKKIGIKGLTKLNNEKKTQTGKGFDMMWTFNTNYDSNEKSMRRLLDYEARGFDISYIELGNEHFWESQRSTRVSSAEKYLAIAKSLSDTLRKERPNVRISLPLSWREAHKDYNATVADDASYFDAITLHKYIGSDPDRAKESNTAYANILTARLTLKESEMYVRSFAPGKKIWLTEWGVSAERGTSKGGAALGMADAYLYIFENQDIYEWSNWFIVNGVLNSFVTFRDRTTRAPNWPIEKTAYASVYEIIRSVFENSTMYNGSIATSELKTRKGNVNAVNARVVTKEGKTYVFIVNLANKPVEFNLTKDNAYVSSSYTHEAFAFDGLHAQPILPMEQNPLKLVKNGSGVTTLPPLSVSKISFDETPMTK